MELETIKAIILPFLQAVATGGAAGLMGYMKQEDLGDSWKVIFTKKFWEKFDPVKALKTILISIIVYGIAYSFKVTITTIEEIGVMVFITYGVDALVKFIVRRTPIVRAWNWLKEQALEVFK